MVRLILDLTRTSVRGVVAEEAPCQPRIRQIVVEPVVDEPDVGTFRHILEQLHITKPAFVVVAIPRQHVSTRLLRLPSTDPAELTNMVTLVSKTPLPYPPEQTVVDFQVVEQEAGMSLVSLVAVQRDRVARSISVLQQAGCEPRLIVPTSWGLLAWYRRFGHAAEGIHEPVMVINVEAGWIDLVLVHQDHLRFSRSISRRTEDERGHRDETALSVDEITRSFLSLRRAHATLEVKSILLTGTGALEPWQAVLNEHLAIPVIVKRAEDGVEMPPDALPAWASLAVALGLAASERDWLVNLLPRDVRQAQRDRWHRRELISIGSLLLVALSVGIAALAAVVCSQERVVASFHTMLKREEARDEHRKQRERDVKLLETALASRRGTAGMLRELFQSTPAEVSFESLAFDRAHGECVVRGHAASMTRLLEYLRQLEQSKHWATVALHHATRRGASADSDTDFEIAVRDAS